MRLSSADVKWLFERLRKVDFLSYHSEEELTRLVSSMDALRVRAGETIVKQAQRGKAYYIIREGSVAVWAETPDGRKKLSSLAAGDSFGEVSVLTGEVCNATVAAEEDSVLFALPPESLREVARSNPLLAERMAKAVSERKGVRALGLEPAAGSSTDLLGRVRAFLGLSP